MRSSFSKQLRSLGYSSYSSYLWSDHWRETRQRFFRSKLFKGRCFACGGRGPFEIHHRTYKRIGREWLIDLVAVCHPCHLEAHRLEGSTSRITLWNSIKRVRAAHAGGRGAARRAHRPLAGTVRAVRPRVGRGHVS